MDVSIDVAIHPPVYSSIHSAHLCSAERCHSVAVNVHMYMALICLVGVLLSSLKVESDDLFL